MENIIWIIIATAVILTLAGIMLFLGSDSLTSLSQGSEDLMDMDRPDDWQSHTPIQFTLKPSEYQYLSFSQDIMDKFIDSITAHF